MAELDGLRIHALADEQASYSSGLFLAVDDSGFTNTKKVEIGTIYPKTNTLSAAGDFNPATSLLRLDNGSGSETKVTVNNFLGDADVITTLKSILSLNVTNLAFTGVPDAAYTITTSDGRKYGNVSMINFQISASSQGGLRFLKNITDYDNPGFTVFFVANNDDEEADDSGWGQITTDGDIYVAVGANGIWRFQATIISAF